MKIILYMCCLFFYAVEGGSYKNVSLLHSDILTTYNKYIRPENYLNSTTEIKVSFLLVTLADLDEVKGQLSIIGFLNLSWTDNVLKWNPGKYDGTYYTRISASKIWKPRLFAANSRDIPAFVDTKDSLIVVYYDGTCGWFPGVIWNLRCKIDTTKFPFDIQKCYVYLTTSPYSSLEIRFVPTYKTLQREFFLEDATWELIHENVYEDTTKYLPAVQFDIHFRRRHQYFVVTLLIPLCFIGILNILVFKIPAESGERIGYAITVLLAVSVFMTIASDILPSSSLPRLSFISILLLQNLILSCFVMVSTIFGLRCYHTARDKPVHWMYYQVVCYKRWRKSRKVSGDVVTDQTGKENNLSVTITWKDVGETFDELFFYLYFLLLVTIYVVYIIQIVL